MSESIGCKAYCDVCLGVTTHLIDHCHDSKTDAPFTDLVCVDCRQISLTLEGHVYIGQSRQPEIDVLKERLRLANNNLEIMERMIKSLNNDLQKALAQIGGE
ncbi:MAG: hypothetical protein KGL39_39340 [Patescibacteria group bacterium]|nr:hypothetical protein [Patescibacteria group bacterium]